MVAPAPSAPSSPAGPPAPGRSASRSASDRREAIEVLPENDALEHLARRRPDGAVAASCIGRARPHRGNSHRGRRRFSGPTRDGRYCRARYYSPGRQRFVSEDPIGLFDGSHNPYVYVQNNPWGFVDPFGLISERPMLEEPGLIEPWVDPIDLISGLGGLGKLALKPILRKLATKGLSEVVGEEAISIADRQFGRKIAKHARDFGLDPSNPAHRQQMRELIQSIGRNPDQVVEGTFSGQGPVKFFIKGDDVVVTTPAKAFVTILKGGINNPSVLRALGK